ncbi:hypothetical protein CCY99_01610 [Helicobacter sp. 16-1353]|uniref:EAL domain-containing protein n=1 Tax=Helicobacter sp. 16-1353 TaxID=2004996 RepID=UPI000DCE3C12|nr:EAL domain-containing protein [Helicobacter sp. 16-1353]RAX54869.1 hypothetical protein CCY99_01610 [Helicobacter sp. 16-1353]
MISLDKQNVKEIDFFDYLFDRQALLHYLNNTSKDIEIIALLFELEDLDRWFSIYAPNIACKTGEEILAVINGILPPNARFFQISRDTYSIMFEDIKIDKVIEFAHILRTFIVERKFYNNLSGFDITPCIGITKGNVDFVIPKAFSALKYAKKFLSKVYFLDIDDKTFEQQQKEEIRLNILVKNAIYDGRIVPFYQPIYNNKLNKITKYECLSRLIDDDKVLYPYDFFNIARQMGFMRSITYSVINNSFKVFKNNDYEFSINITEEDIRDTQMIDYLSNRCMKYSINPSRIIIELLEDIEFGDDDLVVNNILILKNMGFKIAIDDFGYANSNFGRLIKMQIDYIKIDGRFVKNIDTDPISYKIVKSIATLAKTIDVKCIAEFVHSKSIQKLVRKLGIEYSQGYHIGQASSNLLNKV